MMSKQVLATLVAAFIACTLLAQPVAGVSFFLRSGEETCLMQDVIRGEHISGEFSVLPQGDVITVYVRDPTNAVVYHKLAATEGKFAFTSPESGEYKACFSNTADNSTYSLRCTENTPSCLHTCHNVDRVISPLCVYFSNLAHLFAFALDALPLPLQFSRDSKNRALQGNNWR